MRIALVALLLAACSPAGTSGHTGTTTPEAPGVVRLSSRGASTTYKLGYEPYRGVNWLRTDEVVTTTLTPPGAPPRTWSTRQTWTSRIEARGASADGILRFTSEVVEGSITDHDGTTRPRTIYPGLVRNRAYAPGTGAWREFSWKLPPGMSQATADELDDHGYFPYEVILPNLHVGVGATWPGGKTMVSTDLREESSVDSLYSVRAIDAAGAEVIKIVYGSSPDFTTEAATASYEHRNGHYTVNQTTWVQGGQLPYKVEVVTTSLYDVTAITKSGERAKPAKLKTETKITQRNVPHK